MGIRWVAEVLQARLHASRERDLAPRTEEQPASLWVAMVPGGLGAVLESLFQGEVGEEPHAQKKPQTMRLRTQVSSAARVTQHTCPG